jgi:NAD(P)-dependent dehydrogenase (short-subunit alcohol dehydrogenase family)
MSGELEGRVIAITGSTGGLGRVLALAAAREGAELILLGRNVQKLQGLHAEISQFAPDRALMAPLDLEKAVARDYDALADAVGTRYGRLDGLVHCAALLGTLTPIDHYEVPTWARVMHVNAMAPFVLTQVLLPTLRKSADALIIFTSSTVGRKGRAYWGAYSVSKFATEGLMQVLADEVSGNSSIRVNSINPGPMRTMLRRSAYPAEPLEASVLPETTLAPYLRLLGPRGTGINGQALSSQ